MFVCKRLRLCQYLIDRGINPCETIPDESNPKYNVFLFEETPELNVALVRYFAKDSYTARQNHSQSST